MEKITTIFERDWDGDKKVTPEAAVPLPVNMAATEKLDGTNVRLTTRNNVLVRLEARQNPTKALKQGFGIREPWYRDAWSYGQQQADPSDRYIIEGAVNTMVEAAKGGGVADGEWTGEAIGPKIQGNPLGLEEHRVAFFDRHALPLGLCVPMRSDVPTLTQADTATAEWYYEAMRTFFASARSRLNPERPIEGIVWHGTHGFGGKLKRKDFRELR